MHRPSSGIPFVLEAEFGDIDAMAASPLGWNQDYDQIGRGPFKGRLTQFVSGSVQFGRLFWSPGVIQRGNAPPETWVFGLPIMAEGALYARRRPALAHELLAATSRDDIGFTATGPADLMVAVLPTAQIERWMQMRRGASRFDPHLPTPHLGVSAVEMKRRAGELAALLSSLRMKSRTGEAVSASHLEECIFDAILDMIPSAEVIEPLHQRARIARALLEIFREKLDNPPGITELCMLTGTRERTLFLSCIEAFGRPPKKLLTELRLNGARRTLSNPMERTSVTQVAASFGFLHFGRFAQSYAHQFGELPSATLARAAGRSDAAP